MNFKPENDGIDHINIYSKGKTELGRLMSNFAFTPFELPLEGRFASVEAYWYWLQTKDDRLRGLSGFLAKSAGKKLLTLVDDETFIEGFNKKIKNAICAKINYNPEIGKMLVKSELPFTHYYVFGNKKKEAGFKWLVEFWEGLREELKQNRLFDTIL